jgi:salicylate hydroxylase
MVVGACIDESGADGMFSPIRRALLPHLDASGQGFKKLPLTTLNLRATSPEVRQWVKDENGMNLIYGSGWVAAFIPLKPLSHASEQEDSAEKISNSVYVALTLSHYLVADGLLPTMTDHPSKFFRTLVADPGLEHAQAYTLYTARRTIVGRDRAVLVGDASHGMVPFCGAGASAGIKDAVDLVNTLCKSPNHQPNPADGDQ